MTRADLAYFAQMIDLLPDDAPPPLISAYVQGRRILPPSTPFPGPWDNARTPYWVEVMDSMSPYSPIRHGVLEKPRKMGATAIAENISAYWVDANPTSVEYTTATDELAEDWSTRRWEAVVDSLGFRHKFVAQANTAKSRRTGDKVFKKEFMGGFMDIISSSSMAARRAGDVRVQINDEIDGRPPTLTSGEGRWLEVLHGHTSSWGARAKIFDFSSPTTEELSEIHREAMLGDYRKYLVPCPHCHREQELVDLDDDAQYGIKGIFTAGELVRAVYVCQYCFAEIREQQKTDMFLRGHWQPTKKSSDPGLRSWQIGALYAPAGMISWTAYFRERMAALEDPELMRVFQNIRRGLPYKEKGARPDLRKVILLRGSYAQGTVPEGVIYLTAFVDVQRGKDKHAEVAPGVYDPGKTDAAIMDEVRTCPRLEMEVVGHGRGYKTWGIDHRVFVGPVDDPFAGAWEVMNEWAQQGGLTYRRGESLHFTPAIILIDSSDGNMTDTVYTFCGRWNSTHPSKGAKVIIADPSRREKGDIAGTAFKRWRMLKIGDADRVLYEINTQFYKQALYNKLNTVPRRDTDPQPNGFCDFPRDYTDEYFAQLAAEEQLADGSFKTIRERNEALDCRVGAMAAADIYLMGLIEGLRKAAIANGATREYAEMTIDSRFALSWLENRITRAA